MDRHITLFVFINIAHFFGTNFGVVKSATTSICIQTLYPELCNSLITNKPQATLDQNVLDIHDVSLRATLSRAENVYSLISTTDVSSFNDLGKAAMHDCSYLYQETIYQLNRSIGSTNGPNMLDSQTWLSAAIANVQSCQNGFIDFNLSSHMNMFAFMKSDFSKYLSNSLAINKAMALSSSSTLYSTKQIHNRRLLADGLPEWVAASDRKLMQSSHASVKADIVVAQDDSGNYRTINEAVAAVAKRKTSKRFVIYVKKGVYKENVEIKRSMKNLMFIGDGIDATVVTGNKNVQDGATTFRSATFGVSGDGFIARGITFENTAGAQKHQAVALRSSSDFSVFYGCSFKGYQDTLYVHSNRQFYRDCDIYGTVDFIFGDAVAVLQNCNIYIRKPMSSQRNTVTAQGRSDPNENTGIIIHNSRVNAASELRPVQSSIKSYLGRPWKQYSRTLFMKCTIDGLIDPAGWLPWSGNFALSTLYYGEYMNIGSGAGTGGRVNWPGYHVITNAGEAGKFSVGNFLAGDSWLPGTGVPFTSSL